MYADDILRDYYGIPKTTKIYVSQRFYKENSETEFCVLFVTGHTSRVIHLSGTKYGKLQVVECIHEEDTGIYSYPQIIREWTKRNIVWKFEKPDYYD